MNEQDTLAYVRSAAAAIRLPMDDARASVRCINLSALASRLGIELRPGEDGAGFLRRVLPPDGMVYWPSDRF